MKTYKFKTNINCGGCKASVKPYLDELTGIEAWEVDTDDQQKILTITTDRLGEEQIIQKVEEAGFWAERFEPGLFKKLFG